ncbi:MAG TPA: sporulation initiation factor Spo0A C-terminal domain-containing protein [Clostridia bacterium]|nr:sporulation initiation factor Spo0A C-terminal domain-containing protein [Clostridia bacterium]
MDPVTLVIADDDMIVCDMVQEYFATKEQISVVGEAHDGQELLPLLWAKRPSVLLLDLVMPKKDGFHVLAALQEMPTQARPNVITLTALSQEPFILRTRPYNIFYYMLKPFSLALLYQVVLEAAGQSLPAQIPAPSRSNWDAWISSTLCTLNIPPNFIGFSMLRESVRMTMDDPSLRYGVTKFLYPRLAAQFGSTPDKVERNMRHAIQTAWTRSDAATFQKALGCGLLPRQPSVSEFIALLTERLQAY